MRIVIMGPSGSGKSLIGAAVAAALRADFVDGDDLHPRANVAKMASGTPLDDQDRLPWLHAVALTLNRPKAVVACSALRRSYRDLLRGQVAGLQFVELVVPEARLRSRVSRRDHFMPATLLDSQLATLEPLASDEPGIRVANDADLGSVVHRITDLLTGAASGAQSLR